MRVIAGEAQEETQTERSLRGNEYPSYARHRIKETIVQQCFKYDLAGLHLSGSVWREEAEVSAIEGVKPRSQGQACVC